MSSANRLQTRFAEQTRVVEDSTLHLVEPFKALTEAPLEGLRHGDYHRGFGFDHIFEREVETLYTSNDLVAGMPTSSNSENVVRGLVAEKGLGATSAALLGGDGGRIGQLVDYALIVPPKITARPQAVNTVSG